MGTPTLSQLAARVTAIDGIGSQVPSTASVPTIFNDLNGLHTTISQLTLTIQAQLNTTLTQVNAYIELVNSLLGVSGLNGLLLASAIAAPTSAGTAGTAGQIVYYGGVLYFCSVSGATGGATWNSLNMTRV